MLRHAIDESAAHIKQLFELVKRDEGAEARAGVCVPRVRKPGLSIRRAASNMDGGFEWAGR